LLTLHLWQRLLEKGLRKYGEVYYLGQLPSTRDGALVDCLIGIYAGIETCFQFDTQSGELVGIVMLPRAGSDPCELQLSDYGEVPGGEVPGGEVSGGKVSGRHLPRKWRVLHGEQLFLELKMDQWRFGSAAREDKN